MKNEALGNDYESAVHRAETVLLPAFDSWASGGASDQKATIVVAPYSLDWLFSEFRADRRFTTLDAKTRRLHEVGFRMVGNYRLKDGRRLGQVRLSAIEPAIVDDLYTKLLTVREADAAGTLVVRERRTSVNNAMKSCRRAWNVGLRRHPRSVPMPNPFAQMELVSSNRQTPTATFAELQAFRATALEMGLSSLATAALIAWEWLPREEAIFCVFDVSHYRPKERPHAVRIVEPKTNEESWFPLFDDTGAALYPELMAELDAIKRERIGGLMLCRDWGDRRPWPAWPQPDRPDLTHMSRKVKEIIRAAGLRDELTFTSFRHGGFTEGGDAELTDREIMAQGRHRSPKVLPKYVKRTMRQVEAGAKKRRAVRTNSAQLSE
ncbi:MAG: hypothetical protein ACLPXW_20770 [Xanthobacteraceae bacterium]